MIPLNTVIVAYNIWDQFKDRYPKRVVIVEALANQDTLYYFNSEGNVRQVNVKTGIILECDHDRGFPHMRRIR